MAWVGRRATLKELKQRDQQQSYDDPKRYIFTETAQANILITNKALNLALEPILIRINQPILPTSRIFCHLIADYPVILHHIMNS